MQQPNLTSLESHILREERRYPDASGDFTWIMSAIVLATKAIANHVDRWRIDNAVGAAGGSNVHGEEQQKLDVIANEILTRCLGDQASVAVVASEENEEPMILRTGAEGGKYCILFDPLDGSSNLGVSVGVGTIFSVIRNDPSVTDVYETILRPGAEQVAAGYVVFGSSTVFVVTTGNGVNMYELDRSLGAFVLVAAHVRIPDAARIYSVNEAYSASFDDGYRAYLNWAHDHGYSSRYIGSMVADVHRTLLKGGVFLYPPTAAHREGKLRLMYEANPMAMIMEQAGGKAYANDRRILDIPPVALHERCPVVMGSPAEVDHVMRFVCPNGMS